MENYSFEVSLENVTSSVSGLVFMWFTGEVTKKAPQYFLITMITTWNLCIVIALLKSEWDGDLQKDNTFQI